MPKPPDLDDDTWRIMLGYDGDPYAPRKITVEVFSEYGNKEWTLREFQELFSNVVAGVPVEFRQNVRVVFDGGYDDCSGYLKISYTRPETLAEQEERAKRSLAYAREQQADERDTFERLKAKFGG